MPGPPTYAELAAENAQLRVLVAEQTKLIEALRAEVAELRARLGQSPRNSHKPPSSEGYEKPAPKARRQHTDRKSGGQNGHEGRTLRQAKIPDEVIEHAPQSCGGCGKSLAKAPVVSTEVRQVFDLPPIALHVVEHRLQHRECSCGQVSMATAPVGAPVQYGPGVRGLATYLLAGQYLPLARTAELLTELLGASISQGSLATWYATAGADLEDFDDTLRKALSQAPVLGADETGIRVDGALAWVHTTRTDLLTRYTVSTRRGVEAMKEAGVLPALAPETVLVTDFWSPYWHFDVRHALCGAHLGRELVAAAEVSGQQDWANGLDRLLLEINSTAGRTRDFGANGFAGSLLDTYRHRYNEFIKAGWAANTEYHPGRRGKGKRPRHVNLLNRLDTHRQEVLRFAADLTIPFTNNGSEQDLRPLKIRMKIAGCLRTMAGAETFVRLRSYLSTARKQGQSTHAAMRILHAGTPWTPAITG